MLHVEEKLPVRRVCKGCGRSTVVYYKGRKTRARLANKEDFILLLARRERVVNPMAGCEKVLYAIRPAMAEEGVSMGVNRFYKLMKANGMMVPKRKKYSCTTTKQDKSLVPSPNLVKDMEVNAPDQALCSDITYIYTEGGFLFLSLMMDMYVHDIVGWAVSESLKTAYNADPGADFIPSLYYYLERTEKGGRKSSVLEKDSYLIFRTRTSVDDEGKLKTAHYGTIHGEWMPGKTYMSFVDGCFNPEPNDTNIEDGRQLREILRHAR